jgi:hypothetical protein
MERGACSSRQPKADIPTDVVVLELGARRSILKGSTKRCWLPSSRTRIRDQHRLLAQFGRSHVSTGAKTPAASGRRQLTIDAKHATWTRRRKRLFDRHAGSSCSTAGGLLRRARFTSSSDSRVERRRADGAARALERGSWPSVSSSSR